MNERYVRAGFNWYPFSLGTVIGFEPDSCPGTPTRYSCAQPAHGTPIVSRFKMNVRACVREFAA